MIAPTDRMLAWAGLAVTPLLAAAAARPDLAAPCLALIGLLVLVALGDALAAPGRTRDISVDLPDVVRLSKDRSTSIKVRLEAPPGLKRVRLGLALPPLVETPDLEMAVRLPDEGGPAVIEWPVTGIERGRGLLDMVRVEASSRLGLWAARRSVDAGCEFRIYPNALTERKNLAALFLNRGSFGIHAQRQIGKGRDFEKLREYMPGDNYEDIYWKATARRGRPVTKMYQLERTQEVYVVVDASRLSGRSADGEDGRTTVLEKYLGAALVLGLAAEKQGDLFGLLSFSDRVHSFVRAKNGRHHYNACREALYTLQPRMVSPDYAELFTFIASRMRRRSLILLLTSLDDPVLAESLARDVNVVSRRHLVIAAMVRPPLARPLFAEPVRDADDVYRNLAGHVVWSRLNETGKLLKRRNVGFHLMETGMLSAELVGQYLRVKQRQAL